LFEAVAKDRHLLPGIVEKDYWVMHCLWGLKLQGIKFDLKGGTSLAKGFNLIERFSEDIDIQIYPPESMEIKTGKNHNKPAHIEKRRTFFNCIANQLEMIGMSFERDEMFDDEKMRNAGILMQILIIFIRIVCIHKFIIKLFSNR